ncbi:MAG TPA: HEAT repeat domain-containing protein [Candidatus Acidoferrales bacterium]|nr:HEAT repeat domain-containing protein [Candidatus Acidoferrales bacterium]
MASNRWASAGLIAAMAALCLAVPAGAQDASVGASQSSGASASSGRSASTGSWKSAGTSMSEGISIEMSGLDRAGEALARAGEALGQVERLEPQVNMALERLPEALAPIENLADVSRLESSGELAMGGDDRDQEKAERESDLYDDGQDAIDENKWDKAIEKFDQAIELHGRHIDAAIYWKAYAQNRQGHRTDALATIATLKKDYPQSHWVNEAQALDLEIHQTNGQPVSPDAQSDCELKLLALNGLQQADPAKAVPFLEKILHGGTCPKLGSQALFVLAQSNSQEARDAMSRIARGESNPELQRKAIQDLGLFGGAAGRQTIEQLYSSSSDVDMKKHILQAFMLSGDHERMFNVAKTEKSPELRAEAIRQLGLMGAQDQIWQLYQNETSVEVKKQILSAMWQSGNSEKVGELARNEKDHTLRLAAINDLGLMGERSEPVLLSIYASDQDPEVRGKVINALFLSGDAKGLVTLARKETDPNMKKQIVSKLSIMGSKDATDYLMEILNK